MKIAVSAGHNVYINGIFDPGAVRYPYVESDINKETVKKLIPLLKAQGHEILDVTPYNQKFTGNTNVAARKKHHELRCEKADEFNADIFLDVHVNIGGGTGAEVWVYSMNSKSVSYAEKVCNNISEKLGIPNRGVKANKDYWSVSLCKAPAVIIEGAFIDNEKDMGKLTPLKYAVAIAECFGEVKLDNNSGVIYKVQVGAYSIKENAENMVKKLEKAGFDSFIDEVVVKQGEVEGQFNNNTEDDKNEAPTVEGGSDELTYKGLVKNGSRGDNVKELQKTLNKLGYNCGTADGIAGNNTINAIKRFQSDYNLTVDGIAGQATYSMINQALKGKKPTENKNYQILRPDAQTTIVKIPHNQIDKVGVILANTKSKRETLGSMQKRTGYDFIINGGLYWTDSKTGISHPLNLLFSNNSQVTAGKYSRFCLITYKDKSYKFDWYRWTKETMDIIGGSPSLVVNGKINIDKGVMDGGLITARHPRSTIGMDKNYFYLVTIDGRRPKQSMRGMTINELARYMQSLGCTDAINLDGGGSTRLIYKQTVLNKALENRPVHDAIGIKLK